MENKKVYLQIPKVMAEVGAVSKTGNNSLQNYKFRKIDDIYNKLQPALHKHGVFIIPNIVETKEERFDSQKGTPQIRVKVKVAYNIFADDGSQVTAVVDGEAIDSSDKATNKAFTAAFKYMLIQVFCLALEGLDDADETSPEAPKQKNILAEIKEKKKDEIEKVANDPGSYSPKFGKFEGIPLKEIMAHEIVGYVKYIRDESQKKNKPLQGKVLEFVEMAELFLTNAQNEQIPF